MLTKLYAVLENKTPSFLKSLIPQKWRIWLGYQIKVGRRQARTAPPVSISPSMPFELPHFRHSLSLPRGETEQSLMNYLSQFYVKEDGPMPERNYYLQEAFIRFLYTFQLVPAGASQGRLLEIGAAPYFMSLLLKRFTPYELTLVNYFGSAWGIKGVQTLVAPDGRETVLGFDNVNVEMETLPYADGTFDVVLLCEVLEHFTNDPYTALLEIKRVLKPAGTFVLTTPNLGRLESVARLWAGKQISDDYSAYGPYGRHNREYMPDEIERLLVRLGFEVKQLFTSDISPHHGADGIFSDQLMNMLLQERHDGLGQYIFTQAVNVREADPKRPIWLYRSYSNDNTSA